MFSNPWCAAISASDRYESEAPMLTVPAAACAIPVAELVSAVLMVTFEYFS